MPSLYLLSLFNDQILEKRVLRIGQPIDVTGAYGVAVPDGTDVGVPPDVSTLLQAKYDGIKAQYGFFTHVLYDAFQTDGNINTAILTKGLTISPKVGIGFNPPPLSGENFFLSTNQTLVSAPTQILFLYEVFLYEDSDGKSDKFRRQYVPIAPNDPEVQFVVKMSFDGGATQLVGINPGQVTDVPPANQGTDLLVRFDRIGGTKRVYLGSWALLYQ